MTDKFTWSKDDVVFEPHSGNGIPLMRPEDREKAKRVVREAEQRRKTTPDVARPTEIVE